MSRVVYALFALGGVSALVYEVLWMRSFRVVFGSSAGSAAAILAAYFAGMALGNALGARLARGPRPLRLYGIAELVVGASALLVAPWLSLFDSLYPGLYAATGGSPTLLALARLGLAFVALAPATIAMGVTLPLVTRAVVTRADHVARRTAWIYGLNVGGATAGALLATFWLPPALGVRGSIHLAVALNVLIGVTALVLSARSPKGRAPVSPPPPPTPRALGPERLAPMLLLAAAISGFGTLALEVLFVRLLSQSSEGSVYSFGLMLSIFLVFLAAGAVIVARRLDRTDPWRFLAWTQTAAVVAVLLAPILFQWIPILGAFTAASSLQGRLLQLAIGCAVVLGPTVTLVAVVLPATWRMASRDHEIVGRRVGVLTAVNTAAGVVGSLLTGFVLLPRLGLAASVVVVAALYAGLACACHWQAYAGLRRLPGLAVCALVLVGWLALGAWRLPLQPLGDGERLIHYHADEAATVAVTQKPDGSRALRLDHRYLLGSSAAAERELRQGRLPLALHPAPRRVAFIGVATGMTASAVLDFPVERAVAIEVVPGVVDALPLFAAWNRAFYEDLRVDVVVADGRNHMRAGGETFDVVVGDLFVPWHAGTGDLYTVEHFAAVRRQLAPGGLFAQWLPSYQLTVEELRIITASFLAVFPETTLWRNDFHAEQPLLALVGHRDAAAIDPGALDALAARLEEAGRPRSRFLSSLSGIGLLYVSDRAGLHEWAAGARLNRDDDPIIEYQTPVSVFEHRQRDVPSVLELVTRFRPRAWCCESEGSSPEEATRVMRVADLLHDAVLAMTRHNFEREYRLLQEALALGAGDRAVAGVALGAANRYRERGKAVRAEELLATIAAQADAPPAALVTLAEYRESDGDLASAIDLLERASASARGGLGISRTVAKLAERNRSYDIAERHLRRLLEVEPDDPMLRLDLAHALHRQGDSEAAAAEVAAVRALPDLEDRQAVWRTIERRGLGVYVEKAPRP